MAKVRKPRIDSASEVSRIMASAGGTIVCPKHIKLDDSDQPFFKNIIAEFAFSEWSSHKLELAALLARAMNDLQREQIAMRAEDSVFTSAHGVAHANPRKAIIQTLTGNIINFRRTLSLNARAEAATPKIANRRRTMKHIEAMVTKSKDDSLIAKPN